MNINSGHFDVENLPAICYPSCNGIVSIRDNIWKGIDPIILPVNEKQIMLDGIKQENSDRLNELEYQEEEVDHSITSKNVQAVFYLVERVQSEIDFAMFPREPRRFLEKVEVRKRVARFFDHNIQMYCNNLITNIESLMIIDNFPPSKFHGYLNVKTMLENSSGYEKMNHLQTLVSMCRQIIPIDVSIQTINIIEPSISSSSNPSDA